MNDNQLMGSRNAQPARRRFLRSFTWINGALFITTLALLIYSSHYYFTVWCISPTSKAEFRAENQTVSLTWELDPLPSESYSQSFPTFDYRFGVLEGDWRFFYFEVPRIITVNQVGRPQRVALCSLWIPLVITFLGSMYVWHCFRLPPSNRCTNCEYDLTGNQSGRCPECGEPVRLAPGVARS